MLVINERESGGGATPGYPGNDAGCTDSEKSDLSSDFDSDDSYYDEDDYNELLCVNEK